MREAIGGSMLLYIVIFFVLIIVVFFTNVLACSKAYRVKNRIIEIVEKSEDYNTDVENEIAASLGEIGYQIGNCPVTPSGSGSELLENNTGYKYCVYKKTSEEGFYFKIQTYVHFDFPVVGELMDSINIPVSGETKILGKRYDY